MQIQANLKNVRHSPRKLRLLANQVKDMPLDKALSSLELSPKKGARYIKKALRSAVANAVNDYSLEESDLKIGELQVGEGPRYRKPKYRARGRMDIARRRTSHLRVVLESEQEQGGGGG